MNNNFLKKVSNINQILNPMDKIISTLVDAITASGKKFKEIDKNSIFAFLENQGVSRNKWESVYQSLSNVYSSKSGSKNTENPINKAKETVVDYSDSSHNDVKTRQPRKSVFSEIKKIAG